jgi:hypothetical protein
MPAGELKPLVNCPRDPVHKTEPHCPSSPACTWIRCTDCKAVTGLVFGRPHIQGEPSEWLGTGKPPAEST